MQRLLLSRLCRWKRCHAALTKRCLGSTPSPDTGVRASTPTHLPRRAATTLLMPPTGPPLSHASIIREPAERYLTNWFPFSQRGFCSDRNECTRVGASGGPSLIALASKRGMYNPYARVVGDQEHFFGKGASKAILKNCVNY